MVNYELRITNCRAAGRPSVNPALLSRPPLMGLGDGGWRSFPRHPIPPFLSLPAIPTALPSFPPLPPSFPRKRESTPCHYHHNHYRHTARSLLPPHRHSRESGNPRLAITTITVPAASPRPSRPAVIPVSYRHSRRIARLLRRRRHSRRPLPSFPRKRESTPHPPRLAVFIPLASFLPHRPSAPSCHNPRPARISAGGFPLSRE